jgi:two-component system response regulator TtrR
MAMSMPTVHVIDDSEVHLQLLATILRNAGYKVNPYASGTEFLREPQLTPPGCILLDNAMPELTGLQVQEHMEGMSHGLPVIFMSGESTYEDVFTATRKGAFAFLQKPVDNEHLLLVVQQAIAVSRELADVRQATLDTRKLYDALTDREKDVFQLLSAGMVNKSISRKLDIALRTVEYHRANIQRKLNVRSLEELIALGRRLGF